MGAPPPPPDSRVDDLRQQLRALGYLDAGVDRFVLGPAREQRSPLLIALLASLRIGVLAGVLLGPSAAVGIGTRLPGLVLGLRDSVVAAVYMAVLFGAVVWGLSFVVSVLVASLASERVGRRAAPLSRAAGFLVALGCLAYLTLWWGNTNAGLGLSAPLWTAFALGVAVAVSLLLGHAVRLTVLAVIAARYGSVADGPRPMLRSWKLSLGAATVAFTGAAVLLIATASATPGRTEPPALPVVSSGIRIRLIAIDGFDPGVFDELSKAGRVPALAALFSSSHAFTLGSTRDPAAAWTTIATGQPPDVHGVRSLETRRVAGLQGSLSAGQLSRVTTMLRAVTDLVRLTTPAVVSGSERREKTIWEVAADAGLRTAVINWWATWPAPAERGDTGPIVLSDRATLRLEHGGTLDAEIAPAALYPALKAQWPDIQAEARAHVENWLLQPPSGEAEIAGVLKRSADIDAVQLALAERVGTSGLDLLAVYLPGLDIAQHVLLTPGDHALPTSALSARVDALRGYYVFLDRALATFEGDDRELLAVVTGPGRVATASGLFVLAGPHARRGATVTGRAVDVAPTLLHALGVPVSRELAGTPLTGMLDAEFGRKYPVRHIESYGRRAAARSTRGQPLDQEMIDRLRSLGYVR